MTAQTKLDQGEDVACVLVVDDILRNIQVVGGILTNAGYDIVPASNGFQALDRASKCDPDLILLDMMMPEMDGIEVCRRLKLNPKLFPVPVIFLTASSDHEHLVKAFEVGAVDYVTKPFNTSKLLARVRTHLELKSSKDLVDRMNLQLKELNEEKNTFLGIVAHDLRNPINNVLGACELLSTSQQSPEPSIDQSELIGIITRSVEHMSNLVENLLDVNAIESGIVACECECLDMSILTEEVVQDYAAKAESKRQIMMTQYDSPAVASVDPHAAREVLENLISNAIKYSPPAKRITVSVRCLSESVRLEVRDEGPGLTVEDQQKLFGKFARLSAQPTGGEQSIGLGLSIVKKLVERCGGRVRCESEQKQGACFIVDWKRGDLSTYHLPDNLNPPLNGRNSKSLNTELELTEMSA